MIDCGVYINNSVIVNAFKQLLRERTTKYFSLTTRKS